MTQATKPCWSCEAIVEYDVPWCQDCAQVIPLDIAEALATAISEPFAGAIRLAVSDVVRALRGKKHVGERPPLKQQSALSLDDLDIDL